MSGKLVFNWREADRNEYLASFLLSALGLVTPVPRQEDSGVDFYCALADQEKGTATFGFPFLVQVRSTAKPVLHIKAPKKYRHQKRVLPDHLSWLFRQDVPLFIALIDKEEISMRLFSLSPLWFLYHDHETCPDCASLRLVPRTDSSEAGLVGPPRQLGKVTTSPESFEYEVDLGFPVATVSMEDTANRPTLLRQKGFLRLCIEHEVKNLVFSRSGLPHFYWITETDPDKEGPVQAFHHNAAPIDADALKQIYSFLGPALVPLALRYQAGKRTELLEALRVLFLEMPTDTIPPKVQRELSDIFRRK